MADRQILNGIGENLFRGNRAITRAEFTAAIVKALGLKADGTHTFEDVPTTEWYSGVIGTAVEYGIINGKTPTLFKPNMEITREEAMEIIYRASKICGYEEVTGVDNTSKYTDYGTQTEWATEAVKFNINNGFIEGSDGLIRPQANIKRSESATVILRLLQYSNLVDTRTMT